MFQIIFCLCERLLKICDCEEGGGGPGFCTAVGTAVTNTFLANQGRNVKDKDCEDASTPPTSTALVLDEGEFTSPLYCSLCGDMYTTPKTSPTKKLGLSQISLLTLITIINDCILIEFDFKSTMVSMNMSLAPTPTSSPNHMVEIDDELRFISASKVAEVSEPHFQNHHNIY